MNPIEVRLPEYMSSLEDYRPSAHEWRMSTAGNCQRLMEYGILSPPEEEETSGMQTVFRLMVGHKLHNMWQEILVGMLGDDVCDFEKELVIPLEYSEGVLEITGHMDGYIQSLDAVWEFKSCADSTFQMVVNNDSPLDAHIEQANVYATARGAKNILIHYFNKNSHLSAFFFLPQSNELFERTMHKWRSAKENSLKGIKSPRPFHDPTASPCWFCPAKEDCYKDFKAEVNNSGVLKTSHDFQAFEYVTSADQSRSERLRLEKIEKAAKKSLGDWMIGNQFKRLEITGLNESYTVDLKLGKNDNPIVTVKGN